MEAIQIALAIIRHPRENMLLIAQRRGDVHLAHLWEFPGGKCLLGEAPRDAAVREAREEVGLAVSVLEAWPSIVHSYPERTVILSPFLCRADTEEAEALGCAQFAWVRPADLRSYPFPEANAPLIARLENADRLA